MLQLVISQGLTIYTHTTKPIEKQEGYSGWLYIYIYIAPRLGSNTAKRALWLACRSSIYQDTMLYQSSFSHTHAVYTLLHTVSVQQEERITVDGAEWPVDLLARD